MGKIFDAFTRADEDEIEIPVAEPEAAPGIRDRFGLHDELLEPFELPGYLDEDGTVRTVDRNGRAAVAQRQTLTRPGREIELDLSRTDPHLVAFYETDPRSSEQYERLSVTLITAALERPIRRVLVASPEHGDGRTCVTLNLAVALARAKQRVLIIEGDLLRPSMSRLLGIATDTGVYETVKDERPLSRALLRVKRYGFDLLPTSSQVEHSAELLTSTFFHEQLQQLDQDYDFILFDSPPLLETADGGLLVRITDATLLVLRQGQTSAAQMARAIAPLNQDNLLGVVFNRVRRA
ncbi:MAG: CpsD/CapB family tyrosine-protein kinase [Blastocatellia bacterium]